MEELQQENIKLKELLDDREKRIEELKMKLKKYTNPDKNKRYYEKNKEIIIQKAKEHQDKLKKENPELLKEMKRKSYLKKKKSELCV
jgi:dynactin complex subunit